MDVFLRISDFIRGIPASLSQLGADINIAFIKDDRWKYLVTGLGNTLRVTFFALILGLSIGVIIALVRSSWDKVSPTMKKGAGRFFLGLANGICKLYLTVIRGTPVVVQLLIIFFVLLPPSFDKNLAGVIAFGINSGAYVSEIIRAGIMSVDAGQTEAGRSLGFNYTSTMAYIVLPQAFKNMLPSLANEFIVLLKETSVFGFVGGTDLNRAAQIIISRTYSAALPYFTIALIYLVMVMFFSWLVGILERRLRASDH